MHEPETTAGRTEQANNSSVGMRFLVCCDNFKDTASAEAVNAAVVRGLMASKQAFCAGPVFVRSVPLTDGGAGFLNALLAARPDLQEVKLGPEAGIRGPFGRVLQQSRYAVDTKEATAYIEMAAAAGIELVGRLERDALRTTTYGVGQLMRHAAANGARTLYVGLGGSATNDCGAGMLQALGLAITTAAAAGGSAADVGGALDSGRRGDADDDSDARGITGGMLESVMAVGSVTSIRGPCGVLENIDKIFAVTDVTNVLCGATGASAVFGPQKGLKPEDVARVDAAVGQFATLLAQSAVDTTGPADVVVKDLAMVPGAGAAGGCGAALLALGAELLPGASAFARIAGLDELVREADVVITGEGSLDEQTLRYGKTVANVAAAARQRSPPVPVVVVCGRHSVGADPDSGADASAVLARAGIVSVVSLVDLFPIDECITATEACVEAAMRQHAPVFARLKTAVGS